MWTKIESLPKKHGWVWITSKAGTVRCVWFEYRYNQFWSAGDIYPISEIAAWQFAEMPEPYTDQNEVKK